MGPLLIGTVVLGGGYLLYSHFSSTPALQSIRRLTSSGVPVQVVVPVTNTPVKNGIAVIPVPNGNGPNAVYAPPPAVSIIQSALNKLSSTVPAVITPTGASNFTVITNQDVQKALNTLGYATPKLTVDGNIGPLSIAAIKNFQTLTGMPVTGTADLVTKGALGVALVSLAATGSIIGQSGTVQSATLDSMKNLFTAGSMPITTNANVQHALNVLGASPVLAEDGVFGPKTIAAIKAFQIAHGLAADGVAGPKTKTALSLALSPTPAITGESVGWLTMQPKEKLNFG
jgi:peptidoglycan hydrolase-like protein with peptidoglycan-binding domain